MYKARKILTGIMVVVSLFLGASVCAKEIEVTPIPEVLGATTYVDALQSDDFGVGTNWATAKQSIQAAVDVTREGGTVWVADGTYGTNGVAAPGDVQTNRVYFARPMTIRSVNGPDFTTIVGAAGSNGSNDVDSVRGVQMMTNCALFGFTVSGGYTIKTDEYPNYNRDGAGIWMTDGCVVSNCVISGNTTTANGGGVYVDEGLLTHSVISGNQSENGGGGVCLNYGGTVNHCTILNNMDVSWNGGGGASIDGKGKINNSIFYGNQAENGGGIKANGMMPGEVVVNNCLVYDNLATGVGGGICGDQALVVNCTLIGNEAQDTWSGGGGFGESMMGGSSLYNCIIWNNTAPTNSDFHLLSYGDEWSMSVVSNVCASSGVISGVNGCITNNPLFVDVSATNYQLQAISPCANAGVYEIQSDPYNAESKVTVIELSSMDLAGNDRIVNGTVDMGAYEEPTVLPTYAISTTAGANGSISPANPDVFQGLDQPFSILPAIGYRVESLTVDGSPVTPAESYTFEAVDSIHTIEATFVADPQSLAVNSGSGDGSYTNGAPVSIVADAPEVGSRFSEWIVVPSEFIANLGNASETNTTFTMPHVPVTLTAIYEIIFDSDSDGMADAWERDVVSANTNDLLISIADIVPDGNPDGDAFSNLIEYRYGSDPLVREGTALDAWGIYTDGRYDFPAGLHDVVAISAGKQSGGALRADGTVVMWGGNDYSQQDIPVGATNIAQLSVGSTHVLALKEDGSVVDWGSDYYGQLSVPTNATNLVAVATGSTHSLGLRNDGSVVAWGRNNVGQTNVPSSVSSNIVAISAGSQTSYALTESGEVLAWGYNSNGQATVPTAAQSGVVAISGGSSSAMALKDDGTVVEWGFNASPPAGLTNVTQVSEGWWSRAALKADGTVVGWGRDSATAPPKLSNVVAIDAGSGDYTLTLKRSPAYIVEFTAGAHGSLAGAPSVATQPVFDGSRAVPPNILPDAGWIFTGWDKDFITVSSDMTVTATYKSAARTVGTPVAWGNNDTGQNNIPSGLNDAIRVADGNWHSVAVKADGSVVAWGANFNQQTEVPAGLTNVVAIAAGGYHTLAIQADRSVVAWGEINIDYVSQPVVVPSTVTNVIQVAGGSDHSLALLADGSVVVWGDGSEGQANAPAGGLYRIVDIAAGVTHSVALKDNGTVIVWGMESDPYSEPPVPDEVTNIVAVAAGDSFSLALKEDGTVMAWGDNSYGQTTVPSGLTNVVAIAARWEHSMALLEDGTVVCWGEDASGQSSPPSWLNDACAISAGGGHSLALSHAYAPTYEEIVELELEGEEPGGMFDDPNNDGLDNLLSFALGIHLIEGLDGSTNAVVPMIQTANFDGVQFIDFTFNIPAFASPDLTYIIEQKKSLFDEQWDEVSRRVGNGDWVGSAWVSEEDLQNGYQKILVSTETEEEQDAPQGFLRLKVSREGAP